jgi:uncharacterized protein YecE (DUF72 family)
MKTSAPVEGPGLTWFWERVVIPQRPGGAPRERAESHVLRMPLWIGTSGWQYRHWRGKLYPAGLPMDRWFDRYAEAFDTVELNVTFYRQPRPAVFEAWARRAPDGFLYWNNDHRGCAPRDAARFAELAARAGPAVTRAPRPEELPVG